MKKIFAFVLAGMMILSFTACKKYDETLSEINSYAYMFENKEKTESKTESQTESTADSSSDPVSSIESQIEQSGKKITSSQNPDGSITIDLTPSEKKTEQKDVPPPVTDTTDKTKVEEVSSGVVVNNKTYDYTTNQKHTAVGKSSLYYYSILNASQKSVYDKIDAGVKNFDTAIHIGTNLVNNKDYLIFYMYMSDHPEAFYLGNLITIYAIGTQENPQDPNNQGLWISYTSGKNNSEYYRAGTEGGLSEALKNSIIRRKAEVESAVEKIISTIPADAPAQIKEKMIYSKILVNTEYNNNANHLSPENPGDNWTCCGVLLNHTGVCESYAETLQLLLNRVGIVATQQVGTAKVDGTLYNHKWTAVKLDGEWYSCDVTFDDPIGAKPGTANFTHFNLTSAQMKSLGYTLATEAPAEGDPYAQLKYPSCTGTKYAYDNIK